MASHEGRTALVTGGTSGIGLATARLLRDEGVRVVATGRRPASVELAAADLGPEVTVLVADSADPGAGTSLADRVRASHGELDLLFLNAGITDFGALADVTPERYDALFATNVRGVLVGAQALAPLVRDGGAVVVTTSVAGVKGLAGCGVYAATKAAVRSMVRTLARELLPRGVRVNAVSPGPIDTGILERALPPEAAGAARAQMTDANPMQRFGRPEEVAAAVAFLGFDATFTTGAELVVDGGATQL